MPSRRTRKSTSTSGAGSASTTWTAERIAALGPTTDLATAAAILGVSRSAAYKLAARDAFPTPLFRAGTHYRVPTAPILRALHIEPSAASVDGADDVMGDDTSGRMSRDTDTTGREPR